MSKWSRWAPLCGVVFVGCLVVSFALSGNSPGVKASGEKVIGFYTAHRGAQQGAGFVGVYGLVFFLFFAAAFRDYLRRARPETGALAALSFGGAIVMAVGGGILTSVQIALSDGPSALSPGAAQALNVLSNDVFVPLIAGASVFMIANGLVTLRHGVLPGWLGWVALLIGVVALTPVGFIGFLATLGWVLVVSVLIVVREARAKPAPAAGDSAAAAT
ncbi:MAG TPA: hypothetical protein VE984_01715 [Gaiellaceae bacterium]|nr:hypothetical protein [Gaiellaceae bacterium]